MKTALCIFEDELFTNFFPLTYFRPVYDLRYGAMTLAERISRLFPGPPLILEARKYLEDFLKEEHPEAEINEFKADKIIFINGRALLPDKISRLISRADEDTVFYAEKVVVAAVAGPETLKKLTSHAAEKLPKLLFSLCKTKVFLKVELVSFPWDLIQQNADQIKKDFAGFFKSNIAKFPEGVTILGKTQCWIGKKTKFKPHVLIDAAKGPVIIGENCEIGAFSVIEGPVAIGDNCVVKPGSFIYDGTSIGPYSKVGGEIEATIIQGHSNKQHHGFLGHSYLGEWINLGAGTTTSDLKNTYGTIKVGEGSKEIDTGLIFLGAILGDHTKTAINTSLTTGTQVGVFANIFEGTLPKNISSFSWGGGSAKRFELKKALEIAEKMMLRRQHKATAAYKKLITQIYSLALK